MKRGFLFLAFFFFGFHAGFSQYARHSIALYQFNALSINPAFAGTRDFGSLEATYFGNFSEFTELFRSVQLNLAAPFWSSDHSYWGTTFRFEKEGAAVTVTLRPAYSYGLDLDFGRLSFGAVLGVNYFDWDERLNYNQVRDFQNFFSLDGGLGVFLKSEKFFVGLSAIQFFEKDFLEGEKEEDQSIMRENPFFLAGGFNIRIDENHLLKPSVLFKYSNHYSLPDSGAFGQIPDEKAADFALTLVVRDNYHLTGFYGFSNFEDDQKLHRFGLALHVLIANFRLTYGLQRFIRSEPSVELPSSHLFSLGYRFLEEGE